MSKQLTQHGFSFVLSFVTTLLTLTMMGMYIYDYFESGYTSTFSTTYLMILMGFVSMFMLVLTFSILSIESYEKAKPNFHRFFIALGMLLSISTLVGVTAPLNTQVFSIVGLVGSLTFLFLHIFGYALVIRIDRGTGRINKYFRKTQTIRHNKKGETYKSR